MSNYLPFVPDWFMPYALIANQSYLYEFDGELQFFYIFSSDKLQFLPDGCELEVSFCPSDTIDIILTGITDKNKKVYYKETQSVNTKSNQQRHTWLDGLYRFLQSEVETLE